MEFSLNDSVIIFCNEHNHAFFYVAQDHLDGKGVQWKPLYRNGTRIFYCRPENFSGLVLSNPKQ
jgi:hypothetical protein